MRLRPRFPRTMLVALLLACLVWYATALERRERISERQIEAPLTLVNVPAEMVISSDVPRALTLRVRGGQRRLSALDPGETGVIVDLRGLGEGEHEIAVESRNVSAPNGVQVVAVSPDTVPVRLERVVRRRLPVRPRVVGEPAAGFAIGNVAVEPLSVIVAGPRLQLDGMQIVTTDPIDVSGASGAIDVVVPVRSPGPLTMVVEPLAVRVFVAVAEVPEPAPGDGRR